MFLPQQLPLGPFSCPMLTHSPGRTFAINTVSFLPVFHCLKGFTSAVSRSLTYSLTHSLTHSLLPSSSKYKYNDGILPYFQLQIVPEACSSNNSEPPEATTAPAPNLYNSPIPIQISKASYHLHTDTTDGLQLWNLCCIAIDPDL